MGPRNYKLILPAGVEAHNLYNALNTIHDMLRGNVLSLPTGTAKSGRANKLMRARGYIGSGRDYYVAGAPGKAIWSFAVGLNDLLDLKKKNLKNPDYAPSIASAVARADEYLDSATMAEIFTLNDLKALKKFIAPEPDRPGTKHGQDTTVPLSQPSQK